jgi:hypothetical protein
MNAGHIYLSRLLCAFGHLRDDGFDDCAPIDASGCLDAPQYIPAGGTKGALFVERGVPLPGHQILVRRPC